MEGKESFGVIFLVVGNARATVILSAVKDLAKANGVVKIYESS
jgi:hypothetical protein